jgi:hypothetical protein
VRNLKLLRSYRVFQTSCKILKDFIYLFYYSLCFLSNPDYVASNEVVMSEWRIGKDVEGSGRDLILRLQPQHFSGEIE